MQFRTPQFIEVEDKIFGPLTFRQFLYIVGGVGGAFLFYRILPIFISVFAIAAILSFSMALAFYKVNGKPFILTVESFIKYTFSQKLYLWKKEFKMPAPGTTIAPPEENLVPRLYDSKLKDLSWGLDVLDLNRDKPQV
ncbi:MAG: PrgI family protein [Patescibacteria group bacterium]